MGYEKIKQLLNDYYNTSQATFSTSTKMIAYY